MIKVMLIDPWGNDENKYFTGLIDSLYKKVDLTIVSKKDFSGNSTRYRVLPLFSNKSNNNNKITKIKKGINYISAYLKLLRELKTHEYEVVHVQWLLLNKVDKYFLKMIKNHCKKIVYTAHNVFPHVDGEKYLNDLNEIYKIVDVIVLHGEAVRTEFNSVYSMYSDKVYIQRHGTYLKQITDYKIENVEMDLAEKVNKYDKVFVFVGLMFYNKGVDKLIRVWLEKFSESKDLLIVAGKKRSGYTELDQLEEQIKKCDNIYYNNEYINDDNFSYILSSSDVVILPYRHASVSGVIFSAAEFAKPVITTNTGSISEYIIDNVNSFIVEQDNDDLEELIRRVSQELTKDDLKSMGSNLKKHIADNYDWSNIVEKLVHECYMK